MIDGILAVFHNVSMAKRPARRRPQANVVRHFVRQWRKHRGLTQEQLAERIEKTRGLIAQIETGRTDLTEGMIYALSRALECTPGSIFDVNPLERRILVDVADELRHAEQRIQAEALVYVRGLIAGARH